jgi:Fe-S-cluster formation regulator IscX/YfhJ
MRLIPISGHEGTDFRLKYHNWISPSDITSDPRTVNMVEICRMMAELVEHLGNNVVGPDVYAFTSMFELVLNDRDTTKSRMVLISAKSERWCVPEGYEIAYRVAPPWFHTIGYAEDVTAAGELILEALRLAVSDDA